MAYLKASIIIVTEVGLLWTYYVLHLHHVIVIDCESNCGMGEGDIFSAWQSVIYFLCITIEKTNKNKFHKINVKRRCIFKLYKFMLYKHL